MSFRFKQPNNEDDFELFCLRFLREHWPCNTISQYGTRGERQDGIDLVDESGGVPRRVAQCKHHRQDLTIPPAEIQEEVARVLSSGLELDEYWILTTARKTTQCQNTIIRLNQEHKQAGRFKLIVYAWNDIERLLSEMGDAAQDRILNADSGRSAPVLREAIKDALSEALPILGLGTPYINRELESIKGHLDRHEVEAAEARITLLRAQTVERFDGLQTYHLEVYTARVLMAQWKWKAAGDALVVATATGIDTEQANANRVLAQELLGNKAEAHQLARELLGRFPDSCRLTTLLVRTASDEMPFHEVVELAARFTATDEEINLTASFRALTARRFPEAVDYANLAIQVERESPQAWLTLGQAKHAQAFADSAANQATLFQEALEAYSNASKFANREHLSGLDAEILGNRAKVRHMLGDRMAEMDYRRAIEQSNGGDRTRREYITFLLSLDRPVDALAEIEQLTSPTADDEQHRAAALYGRNDGEDRAIAIAIVGDLMQRRNCSCWLQAHLMFVEWQIDHSLQDDARRSVEASGIRDVWPSVYYMLTAELDCSLRQFDSASEAMAEAVRHPHLDLREDVRVIFASVLSRVGDDASALRVLQTLCVRGQFSRETRLLLDCASRLERHDVALQVCEELRLAGHKDRRIIQQELTLLSRYNPERALAVAQLHLRDNPDDAVVKLWQSLLGLRLRRPECVCSDPNALPSPDQLSPAGTAIAIRILIVAKRFADAIAYAYRSVEAFFGDPFVHRQLIIVFNQFADSCQEILGVETVSEDTAVLVCDEQNAAERWIVLEANPTADPTGTVFPIAHRLPQALLGKKKGEQAIVAGESGHSATFTVKSIVHKYIYRVKDCADQFQIRFPGDATFRVLRLGEGDNFDPAPLIRERERWQESIDELDQWYRENPVPLARYAELSHRSIVQSWAHFIRNPNLGLRVDPENRTELELSAAALDEASTLVVDITGLVTLAFLNELELLHDLDVQIVVPRGVVDQVEVLLAMSEPPNNTFATIGLPMADRVGIRNVMTDDSDDLHEFFQGVLHFISANCTVESCAAMVSMEPSDRQLFEKFLGRATLEASLLSMEKQCPMLADDFIVRLTAKSEYGVGGFSTQSLVHRAHRNRTITADRTHRVTAILAAWGYHATFLEGNTFVAAAEYCQWQVDRWPFAQLLRAFGNEVMPQRQRVAFALNVLLILLHQAPSALDRTDVIFGILSGLKEHTLVRRLGANVTVYGHFAPHLIHEIKSCVRVWMDGRGLAVPFTSIRVPDGLIEDATFDLE